MFAGFLVNAGVFVQRPQYVLNIAVARRSLSEILVGCYGFGIVFHDPRMAGGNPVLLLWRQVLAKIDGLARIFLRIDVVAEGQVGFGQSRERERELRIFLSSCLEQFRGIEVLAVAQKLRALIVISK